MSDELYNTRIALGETQRQFAKRFNIRRTAYLGWERYRPPYHVGMQAWIAMVVAKAKREATKRKHRKERKDSTWNS